MSKITPCVQDLIDAFEVMEPSQRRKVIRELQGFCQGYADGRADAWRDLLAVDDLVEEQRKDQAWSTMAATMTDAGVLHHRSRQAQTVTPKGWS